MPSSEFTAALKLHPDDVNAAGERRFAQLYMDATEAYNSSNWVAAIEGLDAIYDINPSYKKTSQLLYASYYNDGWRYEKAGSLTLAKSRYQQALAVNPKGGEASVALARVNARLNPPTPTPTRAPVVSKRIEVNLSTFRAIAWEGNKQVYNFLVGTGEPGRLTLPGNFKILDKIPMAYASTWGLKMPYWMGIYWAGSLENGFHGLPVNRYGQKMWGGYLGTRISYGCIILKDSDAAALYNWAQVGTPVWIHY